MENQKHKPIFFNVKNDYFVSLFIKKVNSGNDLRIMNKQDFNNLLRVLIINK
jgi:hypothetical protein